RVNVVKGNAAEISICAGDGGKMSGVESVGEYGSIRSSAAALAKKIGGTVVVTGKDDLITDGARMVLVHNGHAIMGRVVGTGCMSASVVASFCAVESDYVEAAAAALALYGVAAEKAAAAESRPQAFKFRLMDELSALGEEDMDLVRITR
ncbi:MAG: hydroxyethylthiazole kinase, partial [Spirochaetota bacterium]